MYNIQINLNKVKIKLIQHDMQRRIYDIIISIFGKKNYATSHENRHHELILI